jgi:hypothetical protein
MEFHGHISPPDIGFIKALFKEYRMKTYNSLYTDFDCPQCHKTMDIEIKLTLGQVNRSVYHLGDHYQWLSDRMFKDCGRPEDGNMDVHLDETCPGCGSVFSVTVEIRNDMITRIIHSYGTDQKSAPQNQKRFQNNHLQKQQPAPGEIKYGAKWQITHRIEAALFRLAELGVEIYSLGGDDFTLMIPRGLPEDHYIDIGYLMSQLGDEEFPDGYEGLTCKQKPSRIYPQKIMGNPPVYFVDGYPQGLKYRVQPKSEE